MPRVKSGSLEEVFYFSVVVTQGSRVQPRTVVLTQGGGDLHRL